MVALQNNNNKKIYRKEKRYRWESVQNGYSVMQIMTEKTIK